LINIEETKEQIIKLKSEANTEFSSQEFLTALNKYSTAIALSEQISFKDQLHILYCNRGICFMKMVIYKYI
jgi:hypothetical protein